MKKKRKKEYNFFCECGEIRNGSSKYCIKHQSKSYIKSEPDLANNWRRYWEKLKIGSYETTTPIAGFNIHPENINRPLNKKDKVKK